MQPSGKDPIDSVSKKERKLGRCLGESAVYQLNQSDFFYWSFNYLATARLPIGATGGVPKQNFLTKVLPKLFKSKVRTCRPPRKTLRDLFHFPLM